MDRAEGRRAGTAPALFWLLLCLMAPLAACAPAARLASPPVVVAPQVTAAGITTRDGTVLPTQSWLPADGPPKAVILALHGFNDYANAYDAPGRWWAEHGVATYAYDQRGFGRNPRSGVWAGGDVMVRDMWDAAAALHDRYPDTPLFLTGESMGAAVLLTALAGHDLPAGFRGAILTAPAVWSRATMPFYQSWALALANWTVPWLTVTAPRGLIHVQASDNIPMMIALGRDPLVVKATRVDALKGLTDLMDAAMAATATFHVPSLVMYGQHEELIPREPMRQALARLPDQSQGGPRIAFYPTAWHMMLRDLNAEIVWRDILAWVTDPAAPLPSGMDTNPEIATLLAEGRTS
ncbi:alpha/beta fold hydrolase [Nitrospirillum iridis]|uniref:Alpha-beta hydrolase superfamily lysophospholipase n=1 Tax=Nitrospirillum iridis TaxID=765888 RepID=A0A7X0EEK7_9PROT|nr:alpha/beta fold hydrolase [Nitrospirillum iridis]MBB6254022.1 alpha-beta hydrolase superfamily lysophospholipase [Nitrospirillum iridis]